jgi:hypothetical protein
VGSRGQFDVIAGDRLVASRQKMILVGRHGFPDEQDTVQAIRSLSAGG